MHLQDLGSPSRTLAEKRDSASARSRTHKEELICKALQGPRWLGQFDAPSVAYSGTSDGTILVKKGGAMSSIMADGPRNEPAETANHTRPRVLVTGANGLIGGFVMSAWRAPGSRFDPVGLARQPGPNADVVTDIGDLDALVATCAGIDAIVHLAATSAVDSPWAAVLESNLIGTYNVFEAARRAGVPRVVFASSNHA